MLWIKTKLRPVAWITKKTWEGLKKKEKVYLLYKYSKKSYSKSQYMDLLFFDDNSSYWRFIQRLNKKLALDIEKINKNK